MKRIFELVGPHWRRIALGACCSVVISAMDGSLAWLVKPIVDNVFVEGDKSYLLLIAAGVSAVFFFKGLFMYVQNYLMSSVGAKIVRDVRNKLYRHMIYLPMSHYGRDTTGSMMSRVINDAGTLQALLAFRVKDLFVSSGTIIVLTCVAFYRRWDLTLIALLVLPIAFVIVGRLGRRLKHVSMMAQQRISDITASLSEGLKGIKIIKSFNVEDAESGRFNGMSHAYYREYMRSIRITEATSLIMEMVAGLGVALIIYYGGFLVANKTITSGDFFSFLAAIIMIYTPAKRLAQVHNGFEQAKAYISRIDEIFKTEKEKEGKARLEKFENEIVYSGVSFSYESREEEALTDINLSVRKGEVVALVGRSGSGKTTLVDLLSRFQTPQKGLISIDGVDISSVTLRSLRSMIGMVSQDVILFNDTVRANIAFGIADADGDRIIKAAEAAFAHEFISALPKGYDTVIGESGAMLSGGQRQRMSIARAIYKNPPILILDEATSALDTQSEIMVQRALDRIMDETKAGSAKTIFVIAHRLSTVKRADRIIVLDRGRIAETGTHDELMKRDGLYKQLYALQHGAVPDADSDVFLI